MAVTEAIKPRASLSNLIDRVIDSDWFRLLFPDAGKVTTTVNGEVVRIERRGKVEYQRGEEKHG